MLLLLSYTESAFEEQGCVRPYGAFRGHAELTLPSWLKATIGTAIGTHPSRRVYRIASRNSRADIRRGVK